MRNVLPLLFCSVVLSATSGCADNPSHNGNGSYPAKLTPIIYDSAPTIQPPPRVSERDWDTLYRTLYGECRNQSEPEIRGIINVIYNRWISGLWGDTLTQVLLAPRQFSVWNKRDRARKIITDDERIDPDKMGRLQRIAKEQINARLSQSIRDNTSGADHFYHPGSMLVRKVKYHRHHHRYTRYVRSRPSWYRDGPRVVIGNAVFVKSSRE